MEGKKSNQLSKRVIIRFEDFKRATGYEREERCEMDLVNPQNNRSHHSDSEDLSSFISDDQDDIMAEFQAIIEAYDIKNGDLKDCNI